MPDEAFRYFWIKVTDAVARAGSAKAALALQQTLLEQLTQVAADSPEAAEIAAQQNMTRWYLAGDAVKGTKVVVVAALANARAIEVLPSTDHAQAQGDWEISIAVMPPGYDNQLSASWLDTPVGKTWSLGAIACRLNHAVATFTNG